MGSYIVEGGHPVRGRIRVSGNKNSALPCIAASILTDQEVVLRNMPDIEDVTVMCRIFEHIGGTVEKNGENTLKLRMPTVSELQIPRELSERIRASVLFVGPLLARCGSVAMPPPGGDVIGRRRMDTHFLAMEALGARTLIDGVLEFKSNKLIGADIFLDEASVTATENTVMTAVLAEGETVISNAASEPHVQDLCNMLNAMGADISGIGSNILRIKGVEKLEGTEFEIGADFMEIGSLVGLAAVTRGSLEIEKTQPEQLRMIRLAFNKLGVHWQQHDDVIFVSEQQPMQILSERDGSIARIDDAPWPGFPPDLTSVAVVVATQMTGTVLVHEKMFESRLFFVDKLIGMGARITLCDPHRAVINGPNNLISGVLVSPDIRAGIAMVLAALCARGESVINNAYQIDRGFENIVPRLTSIGCHIRETNE